MRTNRYAPAAAETKTEGNQSLHSGTVVKEAQLSLATPRMIAEPRKEGGVVRLTLALALSKSKLLDELVGSEGSNSSSYKTCLRDILAEAVREACGAVEAEVEAIADKPRDFLGGGIFCYFFQTVISGIYISRSLLNQNW